MDDSIDVYRLYKVTYDPLIREYKYTCIANNGQEETSCKNVIDDPKYSFLVSVTSTRKASGGKKSIIVSPFLGKCLIFNESTGKIEYASENCQEFNDYNRRISLYDDENKRNFQGDFIKFLNDQKSGYVIEKIGHRSIFWNDSKLQQLSDHGIDREKYFALRYFIEDQNSYIDDAIHSYNQSDDSRYYGKAEIENDEIKIVFDDQLAKKLLPSVIKKSILNYDENKFYIWGYKPRPYVIFVCGVPGVGKSRSIQNIIKNNPDYHQAPFILSDDIYYEDHPLFKLLSNITYDNSKHKISPAKRKIFKDYIDNMERLKKVYIIEHRLDHIVEKGDIYFGDYSIFNEYKEKGFLIDIYFIITDNEYLISSNKTERFKREGRYSGMKIKNITKQEIERLLQNVKHKLGEDIFNNYKIIEIK